MLSYLEEAQAEKDGMQALMGTELGKIYVLMETLSNMQELQELAKDETMDTIENVDIYEVNELNAYGNLFKKAEKDENLEWTALDDLMFDIESRARTHARNAKSDLEYAVSKLQDAYKAMQDALAYLQ